MSVELRLSADDLTRCRFAVSPLYETVAAVRTLATPSRRGMHLPWMRAVAREARDLDLSPLVTLMPNFGYVPDFLTPPPRSPIANIGEELARVRATAVDQVARELHWSVESPVPHDVPAGAASLLAEPERARDELADLLERSWEAFVAPFWPQLRELFEADIHHRARRMARDGLAGLFDALHPDVAWKSGRLTIRKQHREARDLRGEGLVLLPSAFNWPDVTVILARPWQPTVIYPPLGIAELWLSHRRPAAGALGDLLGRTRAELLMALAEPATTTALARRHGLSNGAVSEHLGTLRRAGLAHARRDGRAVWYERTPVGEALIGAAGPRKP